MPPPPRGVVEFAGALQVIGQPLDESGHWVSTVEVTGIALR